MGSFFFGKRAIRICLSFCVVSMEIREFCIINQHSFVLCLNSLDGFLICSTGFLHNIYPRGFGVLFSVFLCTKNQL